MYGRFFFLKFRTPKGIDKQCIPRAVWSGYLLFSVLASIYWTPAQISKGNWKQKWESVEMFDIYSSDEEQAGV